MDVMRAGKRKGEVIHIYSRMRIWFILLFALVAQSRLYFKVKFFPTLLPVFLNARLFYLYISYYSCYC
jgi:hypothetical protein